MKTLLWRVSFFYDFVWLHYTEIGRVGNAGIIPALLSPLHFSEKLVR